MGLDGSGDGGGVVGVERARRRAARAVERGVARVGGASGGAEGAKERVEARGESAGSLGDEEVDGTAQVAVQPDSKKSRVVRLSWDASVDVPKKVVRVLTSEDLSGGVDGVVEEGEEEEAQAQDS